MTWVQVITTIASAIGALAIVAGIAWWVISNVFSLRAKIALVEAEIERLKAEIQEIHETCHARELWLRTSGETMARIDKNVVKIAAKMDIPIES